MATSNKHRLAFAIVFLFVFPISLLGKGPIGQSSQSPDNGSTILRSNTRLVVVDVVVADRKGEPVIDLNLKILRCSKMASRKSFSHCNWIRLLSLRSFFKPRSHRHQRKAIKLS